MKIIGHKTDAMFRRYDITADEDLAQAMERVTKLHQATDEKVVQIAK
jgi:hypothetical protein